MIINLMKVWYLVAREDDRLLHLFGFCVLGLTFVSFGCMAPIVLLPFWPHFCLIYVVQSGTREFCCWCQTCYVMAKFELIPFLAVTICYTFLQLQARATYLSKDMHTKVHYQFLAHLLTKSGGSHYFTISVKAQFEQLSTEYSCTQCSQIDNQHHISCSCAIHES